MFFKKSHILKGNLNTELPDNILFFDTETYEIPRENETELKLKLGVACFWKRSTTNKVWFNFNKIESFWNFVFNMIYDKQKLYLIAHNVAFDFRILNGFNVLKENGYIITKIIWQGTTNIWIFKKENKTICILDNMNFFKFSLKILGDSIGLEKLEMPKDDYFEYIGDLQLYCKRDVEIMLKAWELYLNFLEINDLGSFQKTIAGQALSAFRHRFMFKEIFIHIDNKAVKLERESYHGGRTECFFIGNAPKENYYLLDVNSMYPFVMKNYKYPYKLLRIDNNVNLKALLRLGYGIIAKVKINITEPVFSILKDNKLIFPIGKFETVLTTQELKYAITNNLIKECKEANIYSQGILFDNYVDFFYQKRLQYRKENNKAFEYIAKLFLNSLYGKFGQRNEVYEKIGECDIKDNGYFDYYDIDKNKFIKERRINGVIERNIGLKESFDSFVAISSHITANARMELWHYFNIANRKNVLYCDTDSIIVNQKGYDNCKNYIGNKIGQLSLKESGQNLKIFGLKDYIFNDNVVIKGIKKNAEKISDNEFKQVRFEGLSGALRNNRLDKVYISNVIKKLNRDYTKGIIKNNGYVEPFKLNYEIPS